VPHDVVLAARARRAPGEAGARRLPVTVRAGVRT
jgi:hypothetical protein